jgi:hypothetical protein
MKDRGKTKITINKPIDEYGSSIENNMTEGKFKIRLVPGASFEGQKEEGLQSLDRMIQKDPASFQLIADLYAENLNMPNSIEIRNRFRTMVPPEIIEAGKTGQPLPPKQPQPDPMVMIKMQELQLKKQQMEMEAQNKIKQMELEEMKIMMQSHQAGVDFTKELAKIQMERQVAEAQLIENEKRYDAEMQRIQADLHMTHGQNVVKILTHQPNHFKAPNPTKGININE